MCTGFAIIASVLCFFFYEKILIGSTSFGGSYMMFRGISLFAGGFPNEFTITVEYGLGVPSATSAWFYLYLFSIVAFAIFGAFV